MTREIHLCLYLFLCLNFVSADTIFKFVFEYKFIIVLQAKPISNPKNKLKNFLQAIITINSNYVQSGTVQ